MEVIPRLALCQVVHANGIAVFGIVPASGRKPSSAFRPHPQARRLDLRRTFGDGGHALNRRPPAGKRAKTVVGRWMSHKGGRKDAALMRCLTQRAEAAEIEWF